MYVLTSAMLAHQHLLKLSEFKQKYSLGYSRKNPHPHDGRHARKGGRGAGVFELGNPEWRGPQAVLEIQVDGGVKKPCLPSWGCGFFLE